MCYNFTMNTFTCIKPSCDKSYESEEEEAYYCKSCQEANKAIAKQIDAQVAARPKRKRTSNWKEYEEAARAATANGMKGVVVKV